MSILGLARWRDVKRQGRGETEDRCGRVDGIHITKHPRPQRQPAEDASRVPETLLVFRAGAVVRPSDLGQVLFGHLLKVICVNDGTQVRKLRLRLFWLRGW